jgi:hypothetical protein
MNVRAVAKRIRAAGRGMVGLVGVQSNQFPRALDVRRQFRALVVPVLMGGFHITGCLAMLPAVPLDTRCFKSTRFVTEFRASSRKLRAPAVPSFSSVWRISIWNP